MISQKEAEERGLGLGRGVAWAFVMLLGVSVMVFGVRALVDLIWH